LFVISHKKAQNTQGSFLCFCVLCAFLWLKPPPLFAQDARTLLRNAAKALGAENLRRIQYSGTASNAAYTREMDFALPSSDVPWAKQLDVWVLPYGFLKRAATATDVAVARRKINGKKYRVLTFTVEDRFPLNESRENPDGDFLDVTYLVVTRGRLRGYINDHNVIEKVETWNGDVLIESAYSEYKDFGGIKFPTRIVQKRDGAATLDLTVTEVHGK
jgi:hypothetical protein